MQNPSQNTGATPTAAPGSPLDPTEEFLREHPLPPDDPPENKTKSIILIIVATICAIAAVVAIVFLILKLTNQDDGKTKHAIIEPAKEKYTSYEKINLEYQSGGIDVAEYFKQLVYLETDSSKLDSIYESDYGNAYGTSHFDQIRKIIEENYNQLDKDLVAEYLHYNTQDGFNFGPETDNVSSANNIQLAANTRRMKQHYFTKVKYSKNKNFLIWYTTEGDDGITEEQATDVGDALEKTIALYDNTYGVKFKSDISYTSLSDTRKEKAMELLKKNNIDTDAWNHVLSVYIYDFENENTLAAWNTTFSGTIGQIATDLLVGHEFLNAPYITYNKASFDNEATAAQVTNHELFHHYQYLYCRSRGQKSCPNHSDFEYEEMGANFASSRTSPGSNGSFLSNWSWKYSTQIDGGIASVSNPGGVDTGYGAYPYLIAYVAEAGGSAKDALAANAKSNPLGYLESKSTDSQLHAAIAKAALYAVSRNLPSGYVDYSDEEAIPTINKYEVIGDADETLAPGAIKYYQIDKGTDIHAESNNPLTTYVIIGDNKTEVWRSDASSVDITADKCFESHQTCLLAYANGSLTKDAAIRVQVKNLSEPRSFITSYRNYKVDISMSLSMKGITVKTKATGVMDELHQREHINMTTTTAGIDMENEIYTDFYNQKSYTSSPDLGLGDLSKLIGGAAESGWMVDDGAQYFTDLGQMVEKLEAGAEKVTKIDDTHYKLRMSAEDIQDLLSANGDSAANIELPRKDTESTITIKNGLIAQIEYDLSDIAGIDHFTATVKISDYNQAGSVYIPQTVIKQAK